MSIPPIKYYLALEHNQGKAIWIKQRGDTATRTFLKNTKHFKDRFQTDKPEYSDIPVIPDYHDWRDTSFIYGHHAEELPTNTPKPLGKRVIITHYYYASLMHDVLSGKAVIHTGIFHFNNMTPINSYSKKQASNNRNNNICFGIFILQNMYWAYIIDCQKYLQYLGIPVAKKDITWGGNGSQVHSASRLHAKPHKRHNILSFHSLCKNYTITSTVYQPDVYQVGI